MIDTVLRAADPARDLDPDPGSEQARTLLAELLAGPRGDAPERRHAAAGAARRPVRRVVLGGVLAAAAVIVGLAAPMPWDRGGPGVTSAAFAVTKEAGGAIRVSVHWNELSEPAALQSALDRAGARVRLLVRTNPTPGQSRFCAPGHPVAYDSAAVQWNSPGAPSGGFTVRPADFPPGATFVVAVDMAPAGVSGLSTNPPGQPQMEDFQSSMVVGPIPACAH